jgi:hypothetical protein
MLARQRIEVEYACLVQNHLAIENQTLLRELQRISNDQREAIGLVTTAPADQPHAVLLANDEYPVTVRI